MEPMRTRFLPKMTHDEVCEYIKRNDIIYVPFGTVEVHGTFPLDVETTTPEAFALLMAEDAASGWVLSELEEGGTVPEASDPRDVQPEEDDALVSMVALDMDAYAAKYGSKAVRKNVTIPAWLDTWADKHDINYSGVLRDALEYMYQQPVAV